MSTAGWYVFAGPRAKAGRIEGRRVWWCQDRHRGPVSREEAEAFARRLVDNGTDAVVARCEIEMSPHRCRLVEVLS